MPDNLTMTSCLEQIHVAREHRLTIVKPIKFVFRKSAAGIALSHNLGLFHEGCVRCALVLLLTTW